MPRRPPTHRPAGYKQRKAWATTTRSNKERGYSTQWRKIRQAAIRRDQGLCQPCARSGITTAFDEVDHILPKSRGGTDNIDNLQCICRACHKVKTGREGAGVGRDNN